MTVKALKKKNNMSGPFKLRSGNSPLFKNVGSSPVKEQDPSHAETVGVPPKSGDGKPVARDGVHESNKVSEKKSNVAIGTEMVSRTSPGPGWTKTKGTNIWTYNG